MSFENEMNLLAIWAIAFSPIMIGFAVLFYIKNKQSKNILKKSKGTFKEIFGL